MGFDEDLETFKNKVSSPEYISEETYNEKIFENIKHINEYGQEFWYARDLQKALEYTEWRNFTNVINKAKTNCKSETMKNALKNAVELRKNNISEYGANYLNTYITSDNKIIQLPAGSDIPPDCIEKTINS